MKATSNAVVARPAGEQLRECDIPIDGLARFAYRTATEKVMTALRRTKSGYWRMVHRRRDDKTPLGEVCRDILLLANAGAGEAEVRMIEITVRDVIERCYAGRQRRDVRLIDADEQLVDGIEDCLTIRRRNAAEFGKPLAPAELEEEAEANMKLAGLLLERSRALRALAGKATAAAPMVERVQPVVRILCADQVEV